MNQKISAQEIIDKIIDEQIDNPDSGFKDRVEEFRKWILDVADDYWDMIIFSDAFMVFFDLSEDEVLEYIKGNTEIKIKYLKEINKYSDSNEIMKRANNFVKVLSNTGKIRRDYRYFYILFRLLYVLTGEEHFLTMMNICPYEYTEGTEGTKTKDINSLEDIPIHDHGVMFQ